ncbi:hypothetical protein BST41_05130 [Mycolicibacterium porcinum]|nr:hypothetical protein BST41_05130 [Mycolicibacterium porcinum]
MSRIGVKVSAAIGGIAAIAVSVLGTASAQQDHRASLLGSGPSSPMQTGATMTATTPPPEPEIPMAVPGIKGPAPLPPEEQGLPG